MCAACHDATGGNPFLVTRARDRADRRRRPGDDRPLRSGRGGARGRAAARPAACGRARGRARGRDPRSRRGAPPRGGARGPLGRQRRRRGRRAAHRRAAGARRVAGVRPPDPRRGGRRRARAGPDRAAAPARVAAAARRRRRPGAPGAAAAAGRARGRPERGRRPARGGAGRERPRRPARARRPTCGERWPSRRTPATRPDVLLECGFALAAHRHSDAPALLREAIALTPDPAARVEAGLRAARALALAALYAELVEICRMTLADTRGARPETVARVEAELVGLGMTRAETPGGEPRADRARAPRPAAGRPVARERGRPRHVREPPGPRDARAAAFRGRRVRARLDRGHGRRWA